MSKIEPTDQAMSFGAREMRVYPEGRAVPLPLGERLMIAYDSFRLDHPFLADWRIWGFVTIIAILAFGVVRGVTNDHATKSHMANMQQQIDRAPVP